MRCVSPCGGRLKALIMERQTENTATFPPFAQKLIERGKLEDKRDTLLRLLARAGIAFTEDDRARVHGVHRRRNARPVGRQRSGVEDHRGSALLIRPNKPMLPRCALPRIERASARGRMARWAAQ